MMTNGSVANRTNDINLDAVPTIAGKLQSGATLARSKVYDLERKLKATRTLAKVGDSLAKLAADGDIRLSTTVGEILAMIEKGL
jgi:hypothetical protein